MDDPFANLLTSFKKGTDQTDSTNGSPPKKNENVSMNELLSNKSKSINHFSEMLQPTSTKSNSNIAPSVVAPTVTSTNNLLDDFDELFGGTNAAPAMSSTQKKPKKDDLDDIMDMFASTPVSLTPDIPLPIAQDAADSFVVDEIRDMEIAKLMSLELSIEEATSLYDKGTLYDDVILSINRPRSSQNQRNFKESSPRDHSNNFTTNNGGGLFSSLIDKSKQLIDEWTVNHDEDDRMFRNTDFKSDSYRRYSASRNTSNPNLFTSLKDNIIDGDIPHRRRRKQSSTNVDPVKEVQNVVEGDLLNDFNDTLRIQELSTESFDIPKHNRTDPKASGQDNSLLDFGDGLSSNTSSNNHLNDTIPPVLITQIELSGYNEFKERGTGYFKNGDYISASEQYEKSMNSLPMSHPLRIIACSNLLASLLKTGDYKSIVNHSTSALKLFPADSKLWACSIQNSEPSRTYKDIWSKIVSRRAEAFEHIENYQEALDAYQSLIEKNVFDDKIMAGKRRCQKILNPEQHMKPINKPQKTTSMNKPVQADIRSEKAFSSDNLKKVQEQNKKIEQFEAEKLALYDIVEGKINSWKGGKEDDIRHLLSNLQTVISWTAWKPVASSELVLPKKVKITYMRAVAKTHPDKLPSNLDTESKMLAENIFSILSKTWEKFKADNNMN